MSCITLKDYKSDTLKPILYIDSLNPNSVINEMRNYIVSYVRNLNDYNFDRYIYKDMLLKNYNDIYDKIDGYYCTESSDSKIIILHHKNTELGYIYNTINIKKIFKLSFEVCKRIVPLIEKETNEFITFEDELKQVIKKKLIYIE